MSRACTFSLVALVALGLSSPMAAAEPPRKFYGVVSQSPLGAADFKRMARGRVGTVRELLPWASIDRSPVPGKLKWREFDFIVRHASRRGIRILPTVFGTPRWLAPREGCKERPSRCYVHAPQTEYGLDAWRAFVGAAARRYGRGGAFWMNHPKLRYQPIRSWQIWNEQNASYFFAPRADPAQYARLVAAASEAIRAEDPRARVVLGGMYGIPGGEGSMTAYDFLSDLYEIPGFEHSFEGIAMHPYAIYTGRVEEVRSQVTQLRAVATQAGDPGVGLWITEVGWGSDGTGAINPSPAGQAQRLRHALRYLTRKRAELGIALVAWYAWRDVRPGGCGFCPSSGLFKRESLRPKPAWAQFVRFTGGRR